MTKSLFAAAALLGLATLLPADEGMWLFNQPPKEALRKNYGFEITPQFLDHMRMASVRFNNGGSGSFISPDGLLFTNHHVGSDCIQKLSTAEHDYMKNGFHARTLAEEKACPDLEVNVLLGIQDVTAKVNEGIKPGMSNAEANQIRKANMSRIESACVAETGSRCDVVTLFSGGQYHLYRYKKYTDVRLVFAPEADIAAFGGDPDNFTFPRYCLDFAFFRAYENGKPAKPAAFLKWSKEGVKDGELIFVPGNPGTTGRLATVAELEFYRDVAYPLIHGRLQSLIRTLEAFSRQSPENARIARDNLFSQQNSYKAYTGFLRGLRDPKLMARKRDEEHALRAAIAADPQKNAEYGRVWDEVAAAYKELATFYKRYWLLERGAARGSDLLRISRDVLRYAEEKTKPNERRIRDYTDTNLPSLEQELFSPAPVHKAMEVAVLADYFEFLRKEFGAQDEIVKAILQGRTPEEAARHYVNTTSLDNVETRRKLASSADAARSSKDGMMELARILDKPARELRKRYEDNVEAVEKSSAARIAQARFAIYGANEYPDATFTLRLAYGAVKGYRDNRGRPVPYATVYRGLYERAKRAENREPYTLPPNWISAKSRLNLSTPFNFVSTADTHGGNSGSPTLNRNGEVVGILFDGNMEGLPNRFLYTDAQARSVHVASQGIVEALRTVYQADRLLKEIGQ